MKKAKEIVAGLVAASLTYLIGYAVVDIAGDLFKEVTENTDK